ncbi:hypothetical protein [Nostoc sp. GT001]|nr:hypothetical protein [Nostoc sp. GT001]MDM9582248.1 hypothetical protein [Nostoc sp. GT001]
MFIYGNIGIIEICIDGAIADNSKSSAQCQLSCSGNLQTNFD